MSMSIIKLLKQRQDLGICFVVSPQNYFFFLPGMFNSGFGIPTAFGGADFDMNMGGFNSFQHQGYPAFSRQRSSSYDDMSSFARKKAQDPPIEKYLMVTLEELLTGTSKKLKIIRKVLNL